MEIVGVAGPIRDELFDREPSPAIYVPSARNYRSNVSIHLRALDPRLPMVTMQAFHDRSLQVWAVRAGGRLSYVVPRLTALRTE